MDISLKIGIDLDGCGARFVPGFREFCASYFDKPMSKFPDPTIWEFWGEWGLAKEEWVDAFNQFIRFNGFRYLEVEPGFMEALSGLVENGHEIYIITARGTNIYAEKTDKNIVKIETIEWLAELDVPYHGLMFTSHKQHVDCDIFIDDYTKHLEDIRNSGKIAVAFDQSHNQNWDGKRVSNWSEFYNYVLEVANDRAL